MYRLLLSILIIIIWRKIEFESIFRNSFRILGAHQIADEFRFIDIDFFFFLINPSLPNIIIIQFVLSSVVVVVVAGQTCTKNHLLFLSNALTMKIENFPLRIFITYTSYIGFTFSELKWKNWPHLIKCISMIIVHLYAYILFRDYQKNFEKMDAKKISPNYFGTLIDLVAENFFTLEFICSYIFYYGCGYSLIRSCDSKLFNTIYDDTSRKNRIISIAILILINILLLLNYVSYGFWSLQTEYPFELIIKFYSIMMISYSQIFNNLLCIYFKFAIRQVLQQTLQNFIAKKIDDNQCLRIIRTLAKQCNNFHSSISYSILLNILNDSFYLIFF
uniref:Uncharacterized protein LOC113791100 n=1 Tax=Dermatophagoides pteronyssinus TaxID=6956 RepID=A0A6P6XXH7_DERPT|nr:uncharacterized protein LOC113791100 [Dermatophagoides pteronyssinus]